MKGKKKKPYSSMIIVNHILSWCWNYRKHNKKGIDR